VAKKKKATWAGKTLRTLWVIKPVTKAKGNEKKKKDKSACRKSKQKEKDAE